MVKTSFLRVDRDLATARISITFCAIPILIHCTRGSLPGFTWVRSSPELGLTSLSSDDEQNSER